ncbi:hypothetical protein COCSUDRAFT_57536 [Coccomyxa subellipsoidea C-169]|uniref:Uncharacterized protein n=1 Tax=Coccomyxa subellipsoidea (strain C-169) TaxID=574566 RepID=I0YPR6_COCSC|nr:hypothetical protein COCSUDRAFT_57536 [Coccomyxa subellipsoidea C-169]EIE20385.1 hypothetical protein COCSUDRAFT_57536 [Coccomyxa subellipsoidea C-169]|eukprot:XP_005644929.1 hypothetical protein COCSUDRAFT_57536 [Coccomyxa subellipsoidea C-169]
MSTEAGKHTGSGGHQDNYSMEERASKLQVERDQDPDVQQALKEGDESGEKTQSFQEKADPDYVPGAEPTKEDVELDEAEVEPEA